MEFKEIEFQDFMIKLEGYPEFEQASIKWDLQHWGLVEKLCEQEPPLSSEDFEKETLRAVSTQDHVYYALLMYIKKGKSP